MTRSQTMICVLASLLIVSCSRGHRDNSAPKDPQKPVVTDLAGKTVQEVLATKYDKAIFVCNLWSQYSSQFVPSNMPTDKISWDLKNEFATEKAFKINAFVQQSTVQIDVEVKSLRVEDVTLRQQDGTLFKMKYSPVAAIGFKHTILVDYGNGHYTSQNGENERRIIERVADLTLDTSSGPVGDPMRYFNRVECAIETEIKPEYQDQFVVERPH